MHLGMASHVLACRCPEHSKFPSDIAAYDDPLCERHWQAVRHFGINRAAALPVSEYRLTASLIRRAI